MERLLEVPIQRPVAEGPAAPRPGAPADAPKTAPYAAFGIAVDDSKDTIWVTNTAQNTVAVYKQDDLSLVKQFPAELLYHPREVVVDSATGRAYISGSATNEVMAIDTATLEVIDTITIRTSLRGGDFTTMGLALDVKGGRVFAVSRTSDEVAVIDDATLKVVKVYAVAGAKNATSVAFDPATDRLFVASQDSDNLVILNATSGEVLHTTDTGAGAVAVAVDSASGTAFVSNRVAGTLTAVDKDGKVVANIDNGSFPNHVIAPGNGSVYATNKSMGDKDEKGDRLTRLIVAK